MVLFNPELRREAFAYYRTRVSLKHFLRLLFSTPPRHDFEKPLGKAITYLPFDFFILIRPTAVQYRERIIEILTEFRVEICGEDQVERFADLLAILYRKDERILPILREIYPQIEAKGARALVIDCRADKKINLERLKKHIRRHVPMDYHHINTGRGQRDLLLGLNAVHIPEREDLALERPIVRDFQVHRPRPFIPASALGGTPDPAVRLILEACSQSANPLQLSELITMVDPPYLLRKLKRGYVTPFFAARMRGFGLMDQFDSDTAARLGQALEDNLAIHRTRAATLDQYRSVFERQGIPLVLIKGDAIARTSYDQIGHKIFWDHDVLIHFKDQEAAIKLCQNELGLVPMDRNGIATSQREMNDKLQLYHNVHLGPQRESGAFPYAISDSDVKLEIHWEVAEPFHPYRLPTRLFWENLVSQPDGWQVPRPELLFLHLVVHQFKHSCHESRWGVELRQAVDLYQLAKKHARTWDQQFILRTVGELGLETPLFYVLRRNLALFPDLVECRDLAERFAGAGQTGLCPILSGALEYNQVVHDHSIL